MAFSHGTSIAKIDLSVATLAPLKAYVVPNDCGPGVIPPNLADVTQLLLEVHRSNGDLAWVADMVSEAEEQDTPSNAFNREPVAPGRDAYSVLLGNLKPHVLREILKTGDCTDALRRDLESALESLDDGPIPGRVAGPPSHDEARIALSYLTPVAIDDMLDSDTMPDATRALLVEYRKSLG